MTVRDHRRTDRPGATRIWNAAEHEQWTLPAFRALLDLPPWGATWPDAD
jgi:hypothetical protein